jgi:hypothetical protein
MAPLSKKSLENAVILKDHDYFQLHEKAVQATRLGQSFNWYLETNGYADPFYNISREDMRLPS